MDILEPAYKGCVGNVPPPPPLQDETLIKFSKTNIPGAGLNIFKKTNFFVLAYSLNMIFLFFKFKILEFFFCARPFGKFNLDFTSR